MKAEKEKIAKILELLNFLLKTVTGQVSVWPSMWQWLFSEYLLNVTLGFYHVIATSHLISYQKFL